jgi:hypothetical protein
MIQDLEPDHSSQRRRKIRKYCWAFALVLLVLLAAFLFYGAYPDPQFTLANLRGLTPAQITARFGAPYDTVAQSGQTFDLVYVSKYKWVRWAYAIEFTNGQVSDVTATGK